MSSDVMAIRFGYLLLTILYSVLLCGSCRITNVKHRPYGPMQCIQICQSSADASSSIRIYHCLRIRTYVSSSLKNGSVEDSFTCFKEEKVDSSTLSSVLDRLAETKGESHVIEGLQPTTKTIPIEDKIEVQCSDAINLPTACEEGELVEVRNILSQGQEDINCLWDDGRTPVMIAAQMGQMAVFDFLVSKGCDLLAVDDFGDCVLHMACVGGNTDIVRKLVEDKKFDVETRGKYGRTPVMVAAFECRKKVMRLLLTYACDLTAVDDDSDTILHWSCLGGCEDIVEYVLSTDRISIESRGDNGRTPVLRAAENCHNGIINLLERKGCNLATVDDNGDTILHLACIHGCENVLEYILSKDIISLESRGQYGCTPVMRAAEGGHKKMVHSLIRKGCNLGAVDDEGNSLLHLACIGGNLGMVKYLIKLRGINIKGRNNAGETPGQVTENDEIAALFRRRWY